MSESLPGLSVDSVTGIDVSLPVAGPGVRSFAFLIDWHIRLLLALAWWLLGSFLYNGRLALNAPLAHQQAWFGTVMLPAFAIYFLYHPVLEVLMRGRTPGKRSAGIQVVTRSGGLPGAGALLVRNVFRLIDSLPVAYGVGLTLMVLTRESLRCGDMAAGTLLVYERSVADSDLLQSAARRVGRLDPVGAEIVADLLERWESLVPEARVRLARQLLQRYLGAAADLSEADELQWRSRLELLARP
ncbi:MAG TPA: RDD family protein [Steroidobacteraceae bacterium]|nr:RDD family protein [Steroidobacteraceae bacterium]